MRRKAILNLIAISLIVLGFGLIHNPKQMMEYLGSSFIGVGSVYLLLVLLITKPKGKAKSEKKESVN